MLNISKINSIRNINLVYVYSTNSIFSKENNKYVGIKIVYNNSSILEADYKDPLFGDLIKRILERYNKEKNSRNIILLGEFTKKLINEASFYVLTSKEEVYNQINYYSYENKLLNKYRPYLDETIKMIMNQILKTNSFEINSIDGFNRNYKISYSVSGVNKESNIQIFNKNNKMYFRIRNIENSNDSIEGCISQTNNKVISEFSFGNYNGSLEYDALNLESKKQIEINNHLYFVEDHNETLLDDDKNKLIYYLSQLGIDKIDRILKINDNTFLGFISDNIEKDGEIVYRESLTFINLDEDIIRVIRTIKEGFSKYDGIISVLLDEKEDEFNIRKYYDLDREFLIKEIGLDNDYNYSLLELEEDKDLIENSFDDYNPISLNSMEDVKQYKKGIKR